MHRIGDDFVRVRATSIVGDERVSVRKVRGITRISRGPCVTRYFPLFGFGKGRLAVSKDSIQIFECLAPMMGKSFICKSFQ